MNAPALPQIETGQSCLLPKIQPEHGALLRILAEILAEDYLAECQPSAPEVAPGGPVRE